MLAHSKNETKQHRTYLIMSFVSEQPPLLSILTKDQLSSVSFPEDLLVQPVIVEQFHFIDLRAPMPSCVQSVPCDNDAGEGGAEYHVLDGWIGR
jgi:hypothetical protein